MAPRKKFEFPETRFEPEPPKKARKVKRKTGGKQKLKRLSKKLLKSSSKKPGRRPLRQLLVKVDVHELRAINKAAKADKTPKGAWLRRTLLSAALGVPKAAPDISQVVSAPVAVPVPAPVPVMAPIEAPIAPAVPGAPAATAQPWALGRVPQGPAWPPPARGAASMPEETFSGNGFALEEQEPQ